MNKNLLIIGAAIAAFLFLRKKEAKAAVSQTVTKPEVPSIPESEKLKSLLPASFPKEFITYTTTPSGETGLTVKYPEGKMGIPYSVSPDGTVAQ